MNDSTLSTIAGTIPRQRAASEGSRYRRGLRLQPLGSRFPRVKPEDGEDNEAMS